MNPVRAPKAHALSALRAMAAGSLLFSALLHSGGIPDRREENTRCPSQDDGDATRATAAGAHRDTEEDIQIQQPVQQLIQLT